MTPTVHITYDTGCSYKKQINEAFVHVMMCTNVNDAMRKLRVLEIDIPHLLMYRSGNSIHFAQGGRENDLAIISFHNVAVVAYYNDAVGCGSQTLPL